MDGEVVEWASKGCEEREGRKKRKEMMALVSKDSSTERKGQGRGGLGYYLFTQTDPLSTFWGMHGNTTHRADNLAVSRHSTLLFLDNNLKFCYCLSPEESEWLTGRTKHG